MKYITLLGEGGMIWIIFAVILICTKKYRKCGLMMGAALLLMLVINDGILKNLIARPRPFNRFDPADPAMFAVWKDFPFPEIVSRPSRCISVRFSKTAAPADVRSCSRTC